MKLSRGTSGSRHVMSVMVSAFKYYISCTILFNLPVCSNDSQLMVTEAKVRINMQYYTHITLLYVAVMRAHAQVLRSDNDVSEQL